MVFGISGPVGTFSVSVCLSVYHHRWIVLIGEVGSGNGLMKRSVSRE